MSLVRILQTAPVTVTHTFLVGETPTDATGDITVNLKRLDATVVDGPTVATHTGTGEYSYEVPGQADVDMLTLDWSGTVGSGPVQVRDWVEVVGGHLFGLAEARAAHTGLGSTVTYPTDELADKRLSVEQEFEDIARVAFFPRFGVAELSGSGAARLAIPQYLPHRAVRRVRAVAVDGVAWLTADAEAVRASEMGVLTRPGGAIWPAGVRNIRVEYEHGLDFPSERIKEVGILRLRSLASLTTTKIPDRAISYTVMEGGTYRLSTPNRDRTGIPEIDGVLERARRARRTVFA
jgi:hypothetical protein